MRYGKYIIKPGKYYHYLRRLPKEIKQIDGRTFMQISLKTDSLDLAKDRVKDLNKLIEDYWQETLLNPENRFTKLERVSKLAKLFGFKYQTLSETVQGSRESYATRLLTVENYAHSQPHREAILGVSKAPKIRLSDAIEKYWDYSKDKTKHKNQNQFRKWQVPKERAVKNFIKVVGDKCITEITRNDVLDFKDWWYDRLIEKDMSANSPNKDFNNLRVILSKVDEKLRLNLDIRQTFTNINFREKKSEIKRYPFDIDYVQKTLLAKKGKLQGLDEKYWLFICAMADTGARPSELTGLEAENGDIVLDSEIPYIHIRDNKSRQLKNINSERKLPLVGSALYAFKQMPKGFTMYRHNPDSLTTWLNRWLRENGYFPTEKHSLYSLRHTFQDRLTRLEVIERIQADMMGHKITRPKYGKPTELDQMYKWLKKIAFKI